VCGQARKVQAQVDALRGELDGIICGEDDVEDFVLLAEAVDWYDAMR